MKTKNLWQRIQENSWGQSALLSSSAALGQLITYLLLPWLARVYDQQAFSDFSLYYAWIVPLSVISTWKIELAIPHQPDAWSRRKVLIDSLRLALLSSGITALMLVVMQALGMKNGLSAIYIPLGILGLAIPQVLFLYVTSAKKTGASIAYRIINNTVLQLASILLGYWGWGSHGLIIGFLIGQLAGTLTMAFSKEPHVHQQEDTHWKSNWKNWRPYVLFTAPQALLETLQLSGTLWVLEWLFQDPIPGYYFMCWRLLQAPISLISNTLYVVQYNKASSFLSAGKNYCHELIKTSKMLFLPALTMGILLVWKGPELFSWFLGEQWRISGIMAQFLALWFVLQFVVSPFSFIAILAKKQQTALIFSVVDMLLKGLALYLGYIQSSIQLGLMYYSATSGTVLLLQFFWYHQLAAGLHTAQQPR